MQHGRQDGFTEGKIHIVDKFSGRLGTLTKENASLAGIHIGDSQEQVNNLYGKPDKEEQVHSTPFIGWYYEDLGLIFHFYRKDVQEPIEGVVDIHVSEPSNLTTNTGIGIGDSLESIVNKYDEVYGSEPFKLPEDEMYTQNIIIPGTNIAKHLDGYYPSLYFLLKDNKITHILLSNGLERP